jgi:hypothetical protein
MPKDYSVEDYSHPIAEDERYTGPVIFGVPYVQKSSGAAGEIPPSAPQEDPS